MATKLDEILLKLSPLIHIIILFECTAELEQPRIHLGEITWMKNGRGIFYNSTDKGLSHVVVNVLIEIVEFPFYCPYIHPPGISVFLLSGKSLTFKK